MMHICSARLSVATAGLAGCGRSHMMNAYEQKQLGIAAFKAGKHQECVGHYDRALEFYKAAPYQYASVYAETRMARAQCLRGTGRLAEAIAELEANIKILLDETARGNALESLKQMDREFAANLNEELAKWKKELAAKP